MAIPFVQSIDMNSLQILNFVVHSAATAPGAPANGMMWWKNDTYLLQVYEGTTWYRLVEGPTSSTDSGIPAWDGTDGKRLKAGYSVNTTVGSPGSDSILVSEQGIREAISAALASEMTYMGGYNASTNTPDLDTSPSGVMKGDTYTVTVAGTFFTVPVVAGDLLIAEVNDAAAEADWTIVNRNIQENFLELTDTPAAYTGSGGYILRVNSTPNAIEFAALSSIMSNLTQTANGGLATFSYNGTSAVSIALNFTNLVNETVLADTDEFAYYDASGAAMRALTYSALKTALNTDLAFMTATFKTWTIQADSGYTWGSSSVVASGDDTIDLVAGSGIAIVSDATLKAFRISATGTGGLTAAYVSITDGTTTANASGGDTFKLRSANSQLTIVVTDNDATHGDNALFTLALSSLTDTVNGGLADFTFNGTSAVSLALDFTNLTNETTLADTDEFAFYDDGVGMRALTYAALKTAIGSAGFTKILTGDLGSGASPAITHSLALSEPTDIIVQIWRQSDNKEVAVELVAATNTVTVNFGAASLNAAAGDHRYVIIYKG